MTVYASIHTKKPVSQGDSEGVYKGYSRIPVDCEVGALYIRCMFPEVEEDTENVMTHIVLGPNETGDGEVFLTLECLPHIPLKVMQPGKVPNVIIAYPDTLAKSARIAHQMVALGKMKTSDMEPAFFESVNDHLQAHGIPILTVVRSASANMTGRISQMPSFNQVN